MNGESNIQPRSNTMKRPTSYLAALIITTTVLMNVSPVFAQEWRVLLGQGLFQDNQTSKVKVMDKSSLEKNDWLATQTPLVKNAPIANVGPSPRPIEGLLLGSENSQGGSWAPLPSPIGKEGFTLFSF
jgi:hypothetical protein